jgi:hypothetical protein
LVDFMLREFGPDRFLVLFTTCRQASFDDDCRRALGMTVDQMGQAYRADLEKQIDAGGYARQWLSSLELGPAVDPALWKRFIGEYLAAAARLLAPYERVRLTAERL